MLILVFEVLIVQTYLEISFAVSFAMAAIQSWLMFTGGKSKSQKISQYGSSRYKLEVSTFKIEKHSVLKMEK